MTKPKPPRTILVSGSDTKFFPLLREMVLSFKLLKEHQDITLAVLDFGLQQEEKSWLEEQGVRVKAPGMDGIAVPSGIELKSEVMATLSKLSLPVQFGGFDIYLWVDADIWFQTGMSIRLLRQAAETKRMGIVPELDRCYIALEHNPAIQTYRSMRGQQALGEETAKSLSGRPYMNAGLFSLAADAPHWRVWQQCHLRALPKGQFRGGLSQACLTHMLLNGGLPYLPLPATCNWLCHLARPAWNPALEKFVEPLAPHGMIHALHLTDTAKNSPGLRFGGVRPGKAAG